MRTTGKKIHHKHTLFPRLVLGITNQVCAGAISSILHKAQPISLQLEETQHIKGSQEEWGLLGGGVNLPVCLEDLLPA